ncbi:MAG TPA: hypothetical protein VIK00_02580 [Candidatus Limnocylindrales bacterium]
MNLTMPFKAPGDISVDRVSAKWDEMRRALSQEADHLSTVAAQLSREASARTAVATAPVVDAAGARVRHANGSLAELVKAAAGIGTALALSGRKTARDVTQNAQVLSKDLRHVRLTTEPRQTKADFRPGISLLAGFGAGLALMYFLDPERGQTRRKVLRDKLTTWTRRASAAAQEKRDQMQGQMLPETEAQLEPLRWADDGGTAAETSTSPSVDGSTTDTWDEQPQPSVPGSSVA